jgi:hypothetical protein
VLRVLVAGTLVLVTLGSIGLLAASAMVQRSPDWWRQVNPADPRTIQSGQNVENGLTTLFHQERPAVMAGGVAATDGETGKADTGLEDAPEPGRAVSAEWGFAIKAADANAWLNTRLPAWITRREDLSAWPDEIRQIQVDFRDGVVHIGVEVEAVEGVVRVLSADVRPEVREDGSLWLPAELVRVGALPLPAGVVLRTAREQANELVPVSIRQTSDADVLWEAFLGHAPVARQPVVRLADGRRIRILGLRAQHGVLEVRCRTEWEAGEGGDAPAGAGTGLHGELAEESVPR